MKFDDFDKRMRVYEQSIDQYIVPGMYIAARLDGRSFTKLTREICKFEAPFDSRFRDLMVDTTKHIMNCGFKVLYGYTEVRLAVTFPWHLVRRSALIAEWCLCLTLNL